MISPRRNQSLIRVPIRCVGPGWGVNGICKQQLLAYDSLHLM